MTDQEKLISKILSINNQYQEFTKQISTNNNKTKLINENKNIKRIYEYNYITEIEKENILLCLCFCIKTKKDKLKYDVEYLS